MASRLTSDGLRATESLRRRAGKNATSAAAQAAIGGVLVFITYKVLVGVIGTAGVGSWSLALAVCTIATLPSIGIQGAIQHHVAVRIAAGNAAGASDVIVTSAAAVLVLVCAGGACVALLLPRVLPSLAGAEAGASALSLFPWAMTSVGLLSMASVMQAGLDAMQWTMLRSKIYIGATVFYAIAAVTLTSWLGLPGLGWANTAEYALLCGLLVVGLDRAVGRDLLVAARPRVSVLRSMLAYSVGTQLMGGASLLCDPLLKSLFGRFGGLSQIGVFDIASRMVIQLRMVVVGALEIMIPVFSTGRAGEGEAAAARRRYLEVLGLVTGVTGAFMLALSGLAPVVAGFLFAGASPFFISSTVLLSVGWGLNTIAVPAYMVNMGRAHLRANILGQYITLALLVLLGMVLAPVYGGLGVLWAFTVALVLGGFVPLLDLHHRMHLSMSEWWHAVDRPLAVAVAFGGVAGWSAYGVLQAVASSLAKPLLALCCAAPACSVLLRGRAREVFADVLTRRGA